MFEGMQLGNLSCVLLSRSPTVQEYLTGRKSLKRSHQWLVSDESSENILWKFLFFVQLVVFIWFLEIESGRKYSEKLGLLVLRLEIQVAPIFKFSFQRFTIRANFSQKWRWRGGREVQLLLHRVDKHKVVEPICKYHGFWSVIPSP